MFTTAFIQERYGRSLDHALIKVKSNAANLEAAAQHSSRAAQIDTREKVKELDRKTAKIRDEARASQWYSAHQGSVALGYLAEGQNKVNNIDAKVDSVMASE